MSDFMPEYHTKCTILEVPELKAKSDWLWNTPKATYYSQCKQSINKQRK